jgi:hypothetical protein
MGKGSPSRRAHQIECNARMLGTLRFAHPTECRPKAAKGLDALSNRRHG